MKKELNVEQKGDSLAAFLNRRINQMADDDDDRQRIIQEMASAAGIQVDTVNEILNGRIICPPRIRLVAFTEVLDISVSSIISAAEKDGCEYDDEKLISCGTKMENKNDKELIEEISSFCDKYDFKYLKVQSQNCTDCDIEMDKEKSVEITKDQVERPFANEHSCRLISPGEFDTFRRQNNAAQHDGKRIDFIFGIKEDKSKLQAMRYPKSIWTATSAKSHCASKDGSFEAASKYMEIFSGVESKELSLKINDSFKELYGQDVRLAWKSEATERCFEANLQAFNEEEGKWFNVEAITIQDIEEKAGAVLSKANKGKLKQAQSLIGEVLAASEPVEVVTENGTDNNPQPPENDFKEILNRIKLMEKAIDTLAITKSVKNDTENESTQNEDDKEIEIEIEDALPKEKGIEIEDMEEEEIELEVLAQVVADMANDTFKKEIRKVTGKID